MTDLDSYKKMDEDFTRRFRTDYNSADDSVPIPSREDLEFRVMSWEVVKAKNLETVAEVLKDRNSGADEKEDAILAAIGSIDKLKQAKLLLNPDDKAALFSARVEIGELSVRKFELNLKHMSLAERRQGYGKVYKESIRRNEDEVAAAKLKLSEIEV